MKSVYRDKDTGSTALVSKWHGRIYTIDSIATPEGEYRKGGATRAIAQAIRHADRDNITLRLRIAPTGPMRYDDLKAWYERLGFREVGEALTMIKLPKVQYEAVSASSTEGCNRTRPVQLGQVREMRQSWPEEA